MFGFLVAATLSGANTPIAQSFVSGIEDLPLMAGLAETEEGSLVFESPGGRYVEVYAVGTVASAEVGAFYGQSLPQLGWHQTGPKRFRRDDEILAIEYLDGDEGSGVLTVRFALFPAEN